MAAAAVLIGQVTEPWQLYAPMPCLLSAGPAPVSDHHQYARLWFDHKRGMAISLALNGAELGGIIAALLIAMPRLWSNQRPSVLVMIPRLVPAQPKASMALAA